MILILLILVVFGFLIFKHYQAIKRLPPGPLAYPLVGNLPQLIYYSWKKQGIVAAFELFRQRYGNAFTLWMGPFPQINIVDFETNHEVFVKNGNNYKDRFIPPMFDHLSDGHGLVFANGENWAELRRFTMLTLRNMGVGREIMEERIIGELNAKFEEFNSKSVNGSTVVKTSDLFELMVSSIINSMLVGKRFNEENMNEFIELRDLSRRSIEIFTIFDLTVPVWVLKYFFPSRYRASVDANDAINEYVSREARQRLENGEEADEENPKDFVDAFLAKMKKENKNGGHPAYTLKSLKFLLADLWSAGQDTTATTLTSGFNQLVHHPDVMRKVRDELMIVTDNGSRHVSLKDKAQTPYLNATLAEIHRSASIGNVSLLRVSGGLTTINGYQLNKGDLLSPQTGVLHVNAELFENPEKFDPERFIKNEKLAHQLMTFGLGKRSCVGENLARSELYLIIGNILLRYNIKPHGPLPDTADQTPFASLKQPDKTARLEFIRL